MTMTTIIKAIYENGVFRPKKPLTLAEGTEVELILHPPTGDDDPLESVIGIGESGRTDGADEHDHYIHGMPRHQ
jgi:predicted DNA-binding antitoxin AbrB/MazE fold protein